ncbi:hypothetical protein [Comamonas endophytica]|uniref:Uncharacterized protein n=1 Tax=Comamonas endophytica TaxID=2949090 RepID=A0ABY6G9W1_9BURK|nr:MULTISPECIES: hypothetical protein [unclassified Acidovorax]MCD2512076.1 hypothetical protein [Acidovorax sp. D4N7]UYG51856.1 hypothetical protein M9799_00930 [Acidovorax sp. 5MLIR]
MTTCPQFVARGAAPQTPALQLIATTAASWNLIAPVRTRRRARRIALRGFTRPAAARTSCGTAAGAT